MAASAQQTFKSPEEAATALIAAAKVDGDKALLQVLGRSARDIITSGDPVADKAARQDLVKSYEAKQSVAMDDGKATMVIGPTDWPLPIPIVKRGSGWQFDAAAGRQEVLYRRIGRNELSAIQVCLAYVDAQNDYAKTNPRGAYAQRIFSTAGKTDGLYWPAQPGAQPSPLGELAASAAAEGYRNRGKGRAPFHGYYFKILKSQGPAAPGGALDYVVRGAMIGGFGLVAWPAQHGNSGVMTFVVNHAGVVFQKDLGARTARIAARMSAFAPDHTWKRVVDADLKSD